MLTEWTIENFKPVSGSLELPIASITVLAGLNSSGKSSLLQSILLISQTLGNPNLDRPLILNGNIVQLGTFDGILNDHASGPYIRIAFTYSFPRQYPRFPGTRLPPYGVRVTPFDEFIQSVSVSASFVGTVRPSAEAAAIEAVKVILSEAKLIVDTRSSPAQSRALGRAGELDPVSAQSPRRIEAHIRRLNEEEQSAFLKDVSSDFTRLLPYPNSSNYVGRVQSKADGSRTEEEYLTGLAHFLPTRFVGKFNLKTRQDVEQKASIDTVLRLLNAKPYRVRPRRHLEAVLQLLSQTVEPELSQGIRGLQERHRGIELFKGRTLGDLLEWARQTPLSSASRSFFTRRLRSLVAEQLSTSPHFNGSAGLETIRGQYELETLDSGARHITNFLTAMVRYLGPLRADPQTAQRFAPSSEPDDVGAKGEYAAAVYDANRAQRIVWWHPTEGNQVTSSLAEAMDAWVRHLGVAHRVSTAEAGLSGVSWMIQPLPESRERTLPSVGVGVSQVLPILVAGLLAPTGALLLFEQPELHLHARAQARLGDFFLGLSKVGKQCLIETHSDCLVNQFRYQIVSRSVSEEEDIVIYFIEQDEQGDAHFVPVEISERGNIVNWPDGFFDESLHQEDRITRASVLARTPRGVSS